MVAAGQSQAPILLALLLLLLPPRAARTWLQTNNLPEAEVSCWVGGLPGWGGKQGRPACCAFFTVAPQASCAAKRPAVILCSLGSSQVHPCADCAPCLTSFDRRGAQSGRHLLWDDTTALIAPAPTESAAPYKPVAVVLAFAPGQAVSVDPSSGQIIDSADIRAPSCNHDSTQTSCNEDILVGTAAASRVAILVGLRPLL